jgi:glycosyltransferase involved in cell wall biosynthesis
MNAPSGFDAEELLRARPFDPRPPGKLLLVTGRLAAYKQVDRIVEAVQHLPSDYRLVVLGDGPEREALGQLARQVGVAERVQLLGEVPREDLLSWYRSADVLVTMSRHEALGISAMEGAVAGSGVVASDLPSRHLVASFLPAGRMSLISPDCSAAELAAAIQAAAPRVDPADLGGWSIPTWKDCTDVNVAAFQAALGAAWSPLLAVTGPVQRPLSAASRA